jgi:hypothetical protein
VAVVTVEMVTVAGASPAGRAMAVVTVEVVTVARASPAGRAMAVVIPRPVHRLSVDDS